MICKDCLKGSFYDRTTTPVVSECEVCHDSRPCIPGNRIGLFIPFIPLVIADIFETEPIVDKNQCQKCKGKRVLLMLCGRCMEKKCSHLMKPASPDCLSCVASSS